MAMIWWFKEPVKVRFCLHKQWFSGVAYQDIIMRDGDGAEFEMGEISGYEVEGEW